MNSALMTKLYAHEASANRVDNIDRIRQSASLERPAWSPTKIFVLVGAAIVLIVTAVILARTVSYSSAHAAAAGRAPDLALVEGASDRLAGSLRIPTISHEDPSAFDAEAFRRLHAYLETAFPRAHRQLRRETVGTHSLLCTWPGTNDALKPILLMGRLDVVPIEPGTDKQWHEDPFSGRIADGFIWGRGAIDNKSAVS